MVQLMRVSNLLQYVFSLPAGSLLKLVHLKLSGRKYLLSGNCKCCGKCCRHINLRYRKGWIRNEKQFSELVKENPEYQRFTVTTKDPLGYLQFNCSWFDSDEGCRDYDKRLDICRRYPNTSLLLHGGKLLKGCGYRLSEGVPFEKYLDKELNTLKDE
ncbi:MAG: YkgJ family cysteine cluster protein [Desulfopila sp.]|jgi:Fe-S-cluster containining protein|nr:YkgJ family cysteine cluster protein [Desulfopila sp.]